MCGKRRGRSLWWCFEPPRNNVLDRENARKFKHAMGFSRSCKRKRRGKRAKARRLRRIMSRRAKQEYGGADENEVFCDASCNPECGAECDASNAKCRDTSHVASRVHKGASATSQRQDCRQTERTRDDDSLSFMKKDESFSYFTTTLPYAPLALSMPQQFSEFCVWGSPIFFKSDYLCKRSSLSHEDGQGNSTSQTTFAGTRDQQRRQHVSMWKGVEFTTF